MNNKISNLRNLFENFDGYILSSSDEVFCEYSPPSLRRLEYLTNFTGSSGLAVISKDKAAFFTDSRYIIQADNEIDKNIFEIFDYSNKNPFNWINENLLDNQVVAFDSNIHTKEFASKFKSFPIDNLVDKIWVDKPDHPISIIEELPLEISGKDRNEKIKIVDDFLKEKKCEAMLIMDPEIINWLLNIRGRDIPTIPLVLCYAIIKGDEVVIYGNFANKTVFRQKKISDIYDDIQSIEGAIFLDPKTTNCKVYDLIKNKKEGLNPLINERSIKNEREIYWHKNAQIEDGKALSKFFKWLQNNYKSQYIDEVIAQDKLLEFRKESEYFIHNSFDTISAYGSNGAIVHYRSSDLTKKKISDDSLYLLDSGGQYVGATTDITRTICLGNPTEEQKINYTLVLKGHINLAEIIFPVGTTGADLDVLARMFLWKQKKNYYHGTGHGVGSFLNVHEGPHGIGKYYHNVALKEGMILSNEPGFYIRDQYGIRIESLLLVCKFSEDYLRFEYLTKVPLAFNLIDFSMLNKEEHDWVMKYQEMCMYE